MSVPEFPEYLPEVWDDGPVETAGLVRDVMALFGDLLRDPRVPWPAKATVVAAVAYVTPGVRRLIRPPRAARLLDPLVVAIALRHLIAAAGYEVLREMWRGDDAGFVWLLVLTGIDA